MNTGSIIQLPPGWIWKTTINMGLDFVEIVDTGLTFGHSVAFVPNVKPAYTLKVGASVKQRNSKNT